ncbi:MULTISPECIES: glycosyltransferase family 4 protein [unclassified Frigoribacterium]|uniref:glycosyltransferase family 4 protein n=1 Tax=unclassified Frigoribacterium TaxID=2627005 RepID=UPI0009E8111A|nr:MULTISPECIES: glycosyltransferase family 4 protein [unclassified Frigoribacterium]
MTSDETFVFWQNAKSIHQAPLIRALSESGSRVVVVAQQELSDGREAMGWDTMDYGAADLITSPRPDELDQIVGAQGGPETHHVFSGLDVYPMVKAARRLVSNETHGHIFMTTESWDPRGAAGALRSLRYRHRAKYLKGVDTLLTIGVHARTQFTGILPRGVRRADFGYFVDEPSEDVGTAPRTVSPEFEFLFVGTMSRLKQVDVLVDNLRGLPRRDWRATFIGDGPLADDVRLAQTALPDNIRVLGSSSNAFVRSVMASADVLILPSAYDGWGAVVSEALMTGTRVLVSDRAGSADLITIPLAGSKFDAGSNSAIKAALVKALQQGKQEQEERERLAKWSAAHLSPHAAADYLKELVREPHKAVAAPWRENENGGLQATKEERR